ncbi:hypothetical protein K505DRAFT_338395 [Melanomma pulvis-pyrius CBS 109.77]|uniref:Uncharacterized protein n=1 Tax=Melanomma pulvis-pyrius CBS 109.77 TaxID=1314802 RepID=A0A6A6X8N7_9PLEO|nr:hypothetical protein K505DRAFT_338395 [Melanomma pulvis-pyrius CBS 109.77]
MRERSRIQPVRLVQFWFPIGSLSRLLAPDNKPAANNDPDNRDLLMSLRMLYPPDAQDLQTAEDTLSGPRPASFGSQTAQETLSGPRPASFGSSVATGANAVPLGQARGVLSHLESPLRSGRRTSPLPGLSRSRSPRRDNRAPPNPRVNPRHEVKNRPCARRHRCHWDKVRGAGSCQNCSSHCPAWRLKCEGCGWLVCSVCQKLIAPRHNREGKRGRRE